MFIGHSEIRFRCTESVSLGGFKPRGLGDLLNAAASALVTVSPSRAGCVCHPHYSPRLSLAWRPGYSTGGEEDRRDRRDIIAAPSFFRLTFLLQLFIYSTEWMCCVQGKSTVSWQCQHCCLSATGNWLLYFYSHGLTLSLLSRILFSVLCLICLLSLVKSHCLVPHNLF